VGERHVPEQVRDLAGDLGELLRVAHVGLARIAERDRHVAEDVARRGDITTTRVDR
jgi:hypothetical protein